MWASEAISLRWKKAAISSSPEPKNVMGPGHCEEFHTSTAFEKDLFNSIGQIISGAMERANLYAENVRRLEEQKTRTISQGALAQLGSFFKNHGGAVQLGSRSGRNYPLDNRRQNYAIAVVHELPETLIAKGDRPRPSGMVGEICKKAPSSTKTMNAIPIRVGWMLTISRKPWAFP
jgi:hypothetical protein